MPRAHQSAGGGVSVSAKFSMIVAMTPNRVIGVDNKLAWKMPADMKYFRETTMGHAVVMGRKTFESIGRALPGRLNVVVTRGDGAGLPAGVHKAGSLPEALALVRELAPSDAEPFILGGASLYAEALKADGAAGAAGFLGRLYVTLVEADLQGDAFFPTIDERVWKLRRENRHDADEKNPYAYAFRTYEKD